MALTEAKRTQLAEKLIDLANILLGGLVLGQAFLENKFNLVLAITGGLLFFCLWALAIWIMRR